VLQNMHFIQLRRRNKKVAGGLDPPSHIALAVYLASGVILVDLGKCVVCRYLRDSESCDSVDMVRFAPFSFAAKAFV
jgi:hypothetical protein